MLALTLPTFLRFPVGADAGDRASKAHTAQCALHCESARNIWGPVAGFHIAAYSCEVTPGQFIAYAKVFACKPSDFWDGTGLDKFTSDRQWSSGSAAILDAVFIAEYAIARRRVRTRTLTA